jgi:phosphinothricin acetyltransferase
MPIRLATEQDVPFILAIYNDVIATTTAVYAEQPVTLADRLAWFQSRQAQDYPVLIAEDDFGIVGFASFGDFRAAPCYRYTVEHTVHVRADRRRQGVGRGLLEALIPRAAAMGKHVLIAGVDASNLASLALHRRLGFEQVAHFRQVGRKFDRWLDLIFLQRLLS